MRVSTNFVDAWVSRTVGYVVYFSQEGYAADQIVEIVRAAVDEADFDLNQNVNCSMRRKSKRTRLVLSESV